MVQKSIPKYFGLRVYLSSSILYFFLVIPFLAFLAIQSVPKFVAEKPPPVKETKAMIDSLGIDLDSLGNIYEMDMDSLVGSAIVLGENYIDSLATGKLGPKVVVAGEEQEENIAVINDEGPFGTYFLLLFLLTLLSYLAGFIYNRRFKKYFKLKRSGNEVPEKLHAFCKKHLFLTPVVNASILSMPSIIIFIYSLFAILTRAHFDGEAERDLFIQLHYLTLVATILEFLFVYYWQTPGPYQVYRAYFF